MTCRGRSPCPCETPLQPWYDLTDELTGEVVPIYGCPYANINLEIAEWFRWHGYWQKGLMPVAGGILDQSAKYLDVMEYLDLLMEQEPHDADGSRTQHHP